MRPISVWTILLTLALLLMTVAPVLAQTGNPPIKADLAEPAFSLPPAFGLLLIVAIAVGVTIYKERGKKNRKKPKIDANT